MKAKVTSLRTILIASGLLAAFAGASLATEVKENWEKHCQKCHGADGKGQTKMGRQSGVKDYTDPKVQAELKDENAITARRLAWLAGTLLSRRGPLRGCPRGNRHHRLRFSKRHWN